MLKQKWTNRKGYWKARFKNLDTVTMTLIDKQRIGTIREIPLDHFRRIANRLVKLGLYGEELLGHAVDSNASSDSIRDMRDTLNQIEMYSARIKEIAEAKWNKDYPTFPLFRTTTLATADLSETIKPLDTILEEATQE